MRAKTKLRDQVCRDCRDLIFAGIKTAIASRGPRFAEQQQHLTESGAGEELSSKSTTGAHWSSAVGPAPVVVTALFEAPAASSEASGAFSPLVIQAPASLAGIR